LNRKYEIPVLDIRYGRSGIAKASRISEIDSEDNLQSAYFSSAQWFGDDEKISGVVGTPYYVAPPEVLLGRDYTEKVDVWSCGVLLHIMLSGIPLFYGDSMAEIFSESQVYF